MKFGYLVWLFLLLAWRSLVGQGSYTEHFDVAGSWVTTNPQAYLQTSYANAADPANDQFSSNEALRDNVNYRSAPYAWRVKNTANRYFRYECQETVTGFGVYMARWDNDPVPVVHVRYSTNSGASYTNIDTIDGNYFTTNLAFEAYNYTFINPIAPSPSQKIYIEFLTVSGERMLYDDFTLNYATINVDNPVGFDAATFSQTQIDLNWEQNEQSDPVMVAYNTTYSFGTPIGAYDPGDPVGGAIVLYIGPLEYFTHTGLTPGNLYFYKSWSVTAENQYSAGVVDSAYAMFPEPAQHPDGLAAAVNNGPTSIKLSWTDSDATKYLLKGSSGGLGAITVPVDGIAEPDAFLVKNVNASIQQHQFTGLLPETQYFFRIYPYNGIGSNINYKTDGAVPSVSAYTTELNLPLLITEVADPADSSNAKFVEITNTGPGAIDFSNTPVYLCRQTDGSSWGSVALTGIITPGGSHVVAYQAARFVNAYGFSASQNSGNISGNGDDGYYLFYGGNETSGILFDAYGEIGIDGTGTPWEYTDRRAVRKRDILAPGNAWEAGEWVIAPFGSGAKSMTPGFHSGNVSWTGAGSANWSEKGASWSSPWGFIPDASCIVTVPPASINPVISTPATVHQVVLETGASLNIQPSGSLHIIGK